MVINAGKIKLSILLTELEKSFPMEFENSLLNELYTLKKFSKTIYSYITKRPIILYVKENTFPDNVYNKDGIEKYLKYVVGVERNFELAYLKTMPGDKLASKEVDCILIETSQNNIMSLNTLDNLIFLDNFTKKSKNTKGEMKTNQSGNIDYHLFDRYISSNLNDLNLEQLRVGKAKHISQYFLGVQLDKPTYFQAELKYYTSPDAIDLANYKISTNIFYYYCPICNKKHKITLHGYNKKEKVNVFNYIFACQNKNEEKNTPDFFAFKCDHSGTNYYEKNNNFPRISNRFEYPFDLTNEQYDRVFIYLFTRMRYLESNDNQIEYIDENNNIKQHDKSKIMQDCIPK